MVASDALAIIVHARNRVGSLDCATLRAIFEGRVRDWAELGQSVGPIQVVTREQGSGTRETFSRLVMNGRTLTGKALVAGSSGAMLDYVAGHPAAIGYVAASVLREGVRVVPIDGERPEPQKVRVGSYSLMAGVWLVYRHQGAGEEMLGFLLSPEGQGLLSKRYAALEPAFMP